MINFRKFKKILDKKYITIKNIHKINFKKKIILKFGIDPTSSKLHLGHLIILNTIKKLKKINLKIKIVIGCYTSLIGDPSKRYQRRKKIKRKEIEKNFISIKKTIFKFLNKKNIKIYNNNFWLKNINIRKIENINLNKLLSRKEIKKRIKKNENIKIGELIYPFYQNYDNIILNNNSEIGGKDQIYNFFFKNSKFLIIFDLFPSLKKKKKMSSSDSLEDCIYLNENKYDIFWKILRIKDKKIKKIQKFIKTKKNKKTNNKNLNEKISIYLSICKLLKFKNYNKVLNNFINNKKKIIKKNIFIILPENIVSLIYKINIFKSKNNIKKLIKQKSVFINNKIINYKKKILKYKKYYLKIGIKHILINVKKKI
ncbi:tyrosine--tRNA ligase [Candidatus Vidania fulgoroideorum]